MERNVYRYDIDSELEVLPGAPFHFRFGYDFEHHTPLDPFGWQYLVGQREGGQTYHRPVYPVDPGPQNGLEQYQGFRVWYGRHVREMPVNPAVEYHIDPDANRDPADPKKLKVRKLNTAVCAAFYDTGVGYEAETATAGDEASRIDRQRYKLLSCLKQRDSRFVLESDPAVVVPIVALLQEELLAMGLCDTTGGIRAGVALEEALFNSLYHGNLEVPLGQALTTFVEWWSRGSGSPLTDHVIASLRECHLRRGTVRDLQ